jgi:hypothetical protein
LGGDYDGSPYTQSGDLVAELAVRGIRLVIEEFRADVTKTLNYPDCPVMPTSVGSVGVLAAGWGCRWWAGRDKPKLVEASNPRRRWPRDPDALVEPRSVRCAIEPQTETCLPRAKQGRGARRRDARSTTDAGAPITSNQNAVVPLHEYRRCPSLGVGVAGLLAFGRCGD